MSIDKILQLYSIVLFIQQLLLVAIVTSQEPFMTSQEPVMTSDKPVIPSEKREMTSQESFHDTINITDYLKCEPNAAKNCKKNHRTIANKQILSDRTKVLKSNNKSNIEIFIKRKLLSSKIPEITFENYEVISKKYSTMKKLRKSLPSQRNARELIELNNDINATNLNYQNIIGTLNRTSEVKNNNANYGSDKTNYTNGIVRIINNIDNIEDLNVSVNNTNILINNNVTEIINKKYTYNNETIQNKQMKKHRKQDENVEQFHINMKQQILVELEPLAQQDEGKNF